MSVEPGDFINISSVIADIDSEVYRVSSMEVNADFTVKLTCSLFDYQTLAWNVDYDIAYEDPPVYDFQVDPVTNLTYTAGKPEGDHTAIAELTWTPPDDASFKGIVYYRNGSGVDVRLGETASDNFFIYPRAEWANNQSVTFSVAAQTPLGRLSDLVTVTANVVKNPVAPTSFNSVESLYQTNKASGVKARVTLNFSPPTGFVQAKEHKVEYYRDADGGAYKLLGYTVGSSYIFDDVRAGAYHFRITPISWFGDVGPALIGTANILGLSAIPSDPTGFTSKISDAGILLSWDTPTDLDVVSGGTTEIRYVRNDVVTPKWEIAQTIVSNITTCCWLLPNQAY